MYTIERRNIQGNEFAIADFDVDGIQVTVASTVFSENRDYVIFKSKMPLGYTDESLETTVLVTEFFDDIESFMDYLDQFGVSAESLYSAFFDLCQQHLSKYQRLIDTDLYCHIDKFLIALFSIYKFVYQKELSQKESRDIWGILKNESFKRYKEFIYISEFDFTQELLGSSTRTLKKLTDILEGNL